ncbi:MAG: SpoIIE family protein phosphatase, partial [Clostridiales bacterium]|nr:SpoIIE family protein phosphatase [Clostridiales bacterium]
MFRKLRHKILAVILFMSIIPLVVVGVLALLSMNAMRNTTSEVTKEMGDTSASQIKTALVDQIKGEMLTLVTNRAALADEKLKEIQFHTLIVADYAENLYNNPENYKSRPLNYLQPGQEGMTVPHIRTASGISYESIYNELSLLGNVSDALREYLVTGVSVTASYIGTESGFFITVDKGASGPNRKDYDARTRSWYAGAKAAKGLFWTDIFTDSSGRGASVSCAVPVYASDGTLKAVAGTGAELSTISEIVKFTKIGETGYAFLLNDKGHVVITPKTDEFVTDDKGNIIGEDYINNSNAALSSIARQMVAKEHGVQELELDGQAVFLAFCPLEVTDWSIGLVMPYDEAIAPAVSMESSIIELSDVTVAEMGESIGKAVLVLTLIIPICVLIAAILSFSFSGGIVKPILTLTKGVGIIAAGNLDYEMSIRTGDELEILGNSVNIMSRSLKDYMTNLTKVTADKERIATELNVATQIQNSMLPRIFPPWPTRTDLDIFATMLPAKEVGGDFYDFFIVDDRYLFVVMADVSGKGVPAALFMVIAKTLIKNNAQAGLEPKDVLEASNDILCESNDADMFVTCFLGRLDVITGEFVYANAGHNQPLLRRAGTEWKYMQSKPGFVLAGMEGMVYKQSSMTLNQGDELYMYTDGVTEAVNPKLELYGESRLLNSVNSLKGKTLKEFVVSMKKKIDTFAEGAEQADDITMLIL